MKTTNFLRLAVFALAISAPLVAAAAFVPNEWQWQKPIALPSGVIPDGSYVKINLDHESSIYSTPGLRDLRVVADGVSEVPYQLVTETTSEGKIFANATIIDRMFDNGDTILLVDVGAGGGKHNAVDIVAGNGNYRRQVAIYSSDVLLPWSYPKWGWINPSSKDGVLIRSTDAFIYRFTDTELGFSAGGGVVYYPETSARYLRIVIHKENEKKERLDSVTVRVYRELAKVLRNDELETTATITENIELQSTELVVDLGGSGLPTKAITLSLDSESNFNRRATIAGSADGNNWSLVAQGYLFSVRTSLFSGTELTLHYPETNYRYLRVVVFNDDNQPVAFGKKVTLRSVLRSIVFPVSAGKHYALFYGNEKAVTPKYDLARFFQYVESIAVPRASLGGQTANTAYAPSQAPARPLTEQYPQLINVTLVILVALITFILIAYLKKVKLSKPGE